MSKFQGLLVGSIFVHVPFMVRAMSSEGERIRRRLLRHGKLCFDVSLLTEVLLLGRNLDELVGWHVPPRTDVSNDGRGGEGGEERDPAAAKARLPPPGRRDQALTRHWDSSKASPSARPNQVAHRLLVKRVTMDVQEGGHLLITGPNGSGRRLCFGSSPGYGPSRGCGEDPFPVFAPRGR